MMSFQFKPVATLVAVLLGTIGANGQTIPVVAKIYERTDVIVGGKTVQTLTRSGNYYRSTDGSEIYQWTDVNGKPSAGGSLWDKKTSTAYRLDFKTHSAEKGKSLQFPNSGSGELSQGLPEDSVEGILCKVLPVDVHRRGKAAALSAGTGCVSSDYDLELKSDISFPTGPDKIEHHVKQMHDIKVNVQIEQSLFDLSSYTITSPNK
ncbi:MAG: hypothetical protein WB660_30480 [Candidatus Sulfotelmatobacter sp.]